MIFGAQFLHGLIIGSAYVLVALGLTLIYGVLRIMNFAHGEVYMLGAYAAYLAVNSLGLSYWLSIVSALVAGALIGYLVDRLAFRWLRDSPAVNTLICSLGISTFLQQAGIRMFTGRPRSFETALSETIVRFGPVALSVQQILLMATAVVAIVALSAVMQRTRLGRSMRAVAQDGEIAELMGIDRNRVIVTVFVISGVLAGLAGALLSPLRVVDPAMGLDITLKAFVAIIVGGVGNIPGTIVAGLFIGVLESLVTGLVSSAWTTVVTFGTLILVLIVRPQGILGELSDENV